VSGLLQKVAMTSMPDVLAETGIAQLDRWGGQLTPEQRERLQRNVDSLRAGGGTRAAGSGEQTGLVAVPVRDVLGERKKIPTVAIVAAGLGVMFLLFSAA